MARRSSDYAPLVRRRGRDHSRYWLRTARLNWVGWSAIVGCCAAAAGAGQLTARVNRAAAIPTTVLAGATPLVGVLVADRLRWRRMETGYSWTDDEQVLEDVAAGLRAEGIAARVDRSAPEHVRLRFRNRDRANVYGYLRELGYPVPPRRWVSGAPFV